jgi:hypothetical protein
MTSRIAAATLAALGTVGAASVLAQAPNLAGTWKLDAAHSRVAPAAILGGLAPASAPGTLHITQPANGTLVIESQVNEGHVRLYKPGGTTSTPFGQGGTVTMTSRWEGGRLVSQGRHDPPAGATTPGKDVREVLSLSADGAAMTIEVTATTAGPDTATATSTMVYRRTTDVGPCQSWPTPCKT